MNVLKADQVAAALRRGSSAKIDDADPAVKPARFRVGERVRVGVFNPTGHTRAPRYVRGRLGEVVRDHGAFVFPDTHAASGNKKPQHVYSVRFAAEELWGEDDAESTRDAVYLDLWDDYLEKG